MAKANKIEERTERFISEYERIKGIGKLPTHDDLAEIIGAGSKRTITEILGKRQNIQPEQWKKFKSHFNIKDQMDTEYSAQPDLNTEGSYRTKYIALLEQGNSKKDKTIDKLLVAVEKIKVIDEKIDNVKSTVDAQQGKWQAYEPIVLGLREFVTSEIASLKKKSREEVAAALSIKVEEQRQAVEQSYIQNS